MVSAWARADGASELLGCSLNHACDDLTARLCCTVLCCTLLCCAVLCCAVCLLRMPVRHVCGQGESNHPTDPRCICWVSWDRVAVSHQPKSVYDNYCKASSSHAAALAGEDNGGGPSSCSCADAVNSSSVFVRPDAPSARYVGKSPVMLPYTYYTKPAEDYPNSTHIGDNFSTPKNGSCAENATLGLGKDEVQDEGAGAGAAGGCVWKRQASVGIIYYPQLLEAGWDASLPHDTPDDLSGSQHNIAAMASAWETGLGRHMSPRCCGC